MKIKLFVAREIQYFELGIFPFNSYIYSSTCVFNLLTRAFNLPTRAFNLATLAFSLLTRRFELVTHEFELVTRGFELVTPGIGLVSRNSYLVFYFSTDMKLVRLHCNINLAVFCCNMDKTNCYPSISISFSCRQVINPNFP